MEAKKKNVVKIILGSIYALVASFFIFVLLLTLIVPNGMIKIFGVGYYRVKSASMDPVIQVNDYVLAERAKEDDLNSGDIILFNAKRQIGDLEMVEKIFVIHYFGYVDEQGHILTYSESNRNLPADDANKYDLWGTEANPYFVTEKDLVGRCAQIIKSGESLGDFINVFYSPYLYLGLGAASIGGLVTYQLVKASKDKKKKI